MTRPTPRPGVLEIDPYVPGKSSASGGGKVHKLSSNETPLGPSPAAIAAYKAGADSLERYPDGGATALREAIGATYGLNPARIVCGSGSDEILNLIAHAYIGAGRRGDLLAARISGLPDRDQGGGRNTDPSRRRRT